MTRIKLDENLSRHLKKELEQHGCDIRTAAEQGLLGKSDMEIGAVARREGRMLFTLDIEFADIRKHPPGNHGGIVLFRPRSMGPLTVSRFVLGFVRRAQRELAALPKSEYERICGAVRTLAEDPRPHGCTKLTSRTGWRLWPGSSEAAQMKRLPNADAAIVDETKVTGYLLSATQTFGRTKAEFFREFGFVAEDWQALGQALREHALSHPVERVEETPFGRKFIINGPLATPSGRKPRIRTVWFIERGEQAPRLVTAYPIGGGQHDS